MPEDTQKGQEEVKETTTPEPKGEETPEEVSPSEEPTEELPKEASERTKEQFEKLKQHNADLKKQLEERSKLPSVLDLSPSMPVVTPQMREKYLPTPAPQPEPQLVDEQGYVNADVLKRQLQAADYARQKAEEAERRAQEAQQRVARFEQDAETRELYKLYPELDPLNEQFNQEAYDLVRNELTSQIVQSGKRDAVKAADRMSKYFRKPQADQKVIEQRKAVSPAPSGSKTQRPLSDSELDDLRLRSRHDPAAVAERLKRIGL